MKKSIWIPLVCLLLAALMAGTVWGIRALKPEPETPPTLTEDTPEPTATEPETDPEPEVETTVKLTEEQILARKESLQGKYVAILGDSISTYDGISNDGNVRTTIDSYNAWYNGDWQQAMESPNQTYWGAVIEKLGMQLLINNSCGGNKLTQMSGTGVAVDAGYNRVEKLTPNTGELKDTKPDLIFIFMGTNDYISNLPLGELTPDIYENVAFGTDFITPFSFTEAYVITLEKASKLYPDSEIYIFTLIPTHYNDNPALLNEYNNRIRQLAAHYDNVALVDVAANSGISYQNYRDFTFDGTHPNIPGMAAIAQVLEQAILNNPQ